MSERSTWLRRLVVEFGVIVVGVLVALLAESWWQQRGERVEERQTLERLSGELGADSTLLALWGDWLDFVIPSFDGARRALDGDTVPAAPGALALTYAAATEVTNARPVGTWDELSASGRLADISDADLRQAIVGFYSAFDDLERQTGELPGEYRTAVTAVVPSTATSAILYGCLRAQGSEPMALRGVRAEAFESLRSCTAVDDTRAAAHLEALRRRDGFREALEARAYEVALLVEAHTVARLRFDSLRVHLDRVLGH